MNYAFNSFQTSNNVIGIEALFLLTAACGLTQKNASKRSLVIYAKTRNSVLIDIKDLGYFWLKKTFSFFLKKGGL
jgi:hypothetical protein